MSLSASTSLLVLGHFANLKLAGDRAVSDAVHLIRPTASTTHPQHHSPHAHHPPHSRSAVPGTRRRRRRRPVLLSRHVKPSTRVGVMSDADLEAELAARRASRARERDRYARAMRSEKLTLLEGELMRLRSEISRLDRPAHSASSPAVGGGTPPTARWESLPNNRPPHPSAAVPRGPAVPASIPGMPPQPVPGGPPPPPPPMPPMMGGEDDPIDPERQKREKEERVRRREAKRKEREAAKKPMTLADIIRGAGPDPVRRLKPSGSTQLQDVHEPDVVPTENFADLKDSLKKTKSVSDEKEESDNADKKNKKKESGEANGDSKEETKKETKEESKEKEADKKEDEKKTEPDDDGEKNSEKEVKEVKEEKPNSGEEVKKSEGEDKKKAKEKKAQVEEKAAEDKFVDALDSADMDEKEDEKEVTKKDMKKDTKEVAKSVVGGEDAMAALKALTSKLPSAGEKGEVGSVSANGNGAKKLGRKRTSLEEKRRLRREANGANGTGGKDGEEGGVGVKED